MAINNGTQQIAPGKYVNESIDVCRGCKGTGISLQDGISECTTCEGSGMVLITKDIQISVKPYKSNSKNDGK